MPNIYCHATTAKISFVLDGAEGMVDLPQLITQEEADLMSIAYALNEYYRRWSRELDSRMYEGSDEDISKVAEPDRFTRRELPPPVQILSSSIYAVELLNNFRLPDTEYVSKLLDGLRKQCQNIVVKFTYIPTRENKAVRLIK